MKLITAFIQPAALDDVSRELLAADILDITVTSCCGHGRSAVLVPSFRGGPDAPDLLPTLLLEVIVPARKADMAIEAIVRAARSGSSGDGKLVITTLDRVVRIGSHPATHDLTEIRRARIRRVRSPSDPPVVSPSGQFGTIGSRQA
ncbi:MAG: P-II family nitrogen regulator [Hyphomicrobium aestuarii]|nr:P-II family nitrogen regulator [Hyphomicrobium aestuarii]